MLFVRKSSLIEKPLRRLPHLTLTLALDHILDFFFMEPRATPAARLALGAAFLRAARFSFLRSALSVIVLRVHSVSLQPCVFFH